MLVIVDYRLILEVMNIWPRKT